MHAAWAGCGFVAWLVACAPAAARPAQPSRALVLGGGGPQSAAWEIGVLKGLRDAGVDLTAADLVVGSSAGAFVGAEVRSGRSLDELYQMELSGGLSPVPPPIASDYYADLRALAADHVGDTPNFRAEIGKRALAAPNPIAEQTWRAQWRQALGTDAWPDRSLKITAVDVADGSVQFFDKSQGVPLDAAMAASTASPGLVAPLPCGHHD